MLEKIIKGFTQKYNVDKLVYFEQFDFAESAIAREKQIKGYSRAKKNALINSIVNNAPEVDIEEKKCQAVVAFCFFHSTLYDSLYYSEFFCIFIFKSNPSPMQFKTAIILFLLAGLTSCSSQDLQTVPYVNLREYAGLWYDISHLPVFFMKGCECTTAEYTLTDKGYVKVLNRCRKGIPGKWNSINGKAFVVPNSGSAKLKVQFFWPIKGDYWIIDLADDYSYAVVGDKSRKYLWILSRTPQMDRNIYDEIIIRTGNKGFPVEKLEFSAQSGCQ